MIHRLPATWVRLGVATLVGACVVAALRPHGVLVGLMGGWTALAAAFCAWTWLVLGRMDAAATRSHATREDPSRFGSWLVLVVASLASIVGVGLLLAAGSARGQGPVPVEAGLGVTAVIGSWLVVHTVYALHYARLYYTLPGRPAIDFGGEAPDYHDFAYLAFTLGMTYQVSDTNLNRREVRRAALRHALLSFLLGAVVLACTVNLVVQLASAP